MGRIAVLLTVMLSACATAPVPLSLGALTRLQIQERAGLFPPDCGVDGHAHEAQYVTLAAWAERNNIVVAPAVLSRRNIRGSVQQGYGGWIVLIGRDLSPDEKLYTLLHELGHIYGPRPPTDDDREMMAEMIAAMVCERIGMNVWPQTTCYLSWRVPSLDDQAWAVQRHGAEIDRTVDALVRVLKS